MNCEYCDKPLNDVDCDNPICKLQVTIKLLELKRNELAADVKANESRIKELNNIHRLIGITPNGLELMIRTLGIDVPGMKISANDAWSWDKVSVENAVTLGLHFLQGIERSAREWSEFIHTRSVKLKINKSQIETSNKLKIVKKVRDKTVVTESGKPEIKLTKFEKLVLSNIKTYGSQDKVIEAFKHMGMPIESCRNLAELNIK